MAQENDPRQTDIFYHHGSVALGLRNVGDRCSSLVVVVVDRWLGKLRCGHTWWTVKFAGTCLFFESARVKRREEALV